MSDLRQQLLKAGLVTEKAVETVEKDERQQNRQKGHRRVKADKRAQQAERERQANERRFAEQERARAERSEQDERELQLQIKQIAESNPFAERTGGPRRWYFVSREQRAPFLEVSDEVAGALAKGGAAIVESPERDTWVVGADAARRIRDLDARWIRTFKG